MLRAITTGLLRFREAAMQNINDPVIKGLIICESAINCLDDEVFGKN